MPWERDGMTAKREFVRLAEKAGINMRELCRRFGVSPTTGYEWLRRYREEGEAGLRERSRRPACSPAKTAEAVEAEVLTMRDQTHWGARKIHDRLMRLEAPVVPPRSTIHSILKRNGRIARDESSKHQAWQRFEHLEPNDLWQMDFKGWFETPGGRCNPLTILDDHSRYSVALRACPDQTTGTVQAELMRVFDRYGLPWRITVDNGSPWGDDGEHRLTKLEVWLIRLGVGVSHSRPFHPQTQGKDERFHRTLDDELLKWVVLRDLTDAQSQFDTWRDRYNHERPHQAISMQTPADRYAPSSRSLPSSLPPIEYGPDDIVRKVDHFGTISFRGRPFRIGKGCAGLPVAIRPTSSDGVFDVFLCHHWIIAINLS